jgi:hypothetical protein
MQNNDTNNISASVKIKRIDPRCKSWAKIIRSGDQIPLPKDVRGAGNIPGPYLPSGTRVELVPAEYLLTGNQLSHGGRWIYFATTIDEDGPINIYMGKSKTKELIKRSVSCGLMSKEKAKELLPGSGDVAAMIRDIHVLRYFDLPNFDEIEKIIKEKETNEKY